MRPYEGRHIWIWEAWKCEDGDPEAIAEKCLKYGVRGVIVKYHDGRGGDIFRFHFRELVGELKSAGLVVGAWGYLYHNDPAKEAELAIASLNDGADWYVADPEAEVERAPNNADLAKRFLEALKSAKPDAVIGYSTFPYASLHRRFPYRIYDAYCDVAMPQVYWRTIGATPERCWERTLRGYAGLGLTKPIAPVGQAYNVPADEMRRFQDLVAGQPGVSWWSWQHLENWEVFAEQRGVPVAMDVRLPTLKLGSRGQAVEFLQVLLGIEADGVFGPVTDSAVRNFQSRTGLSVDGVVGPMTWRELAKSHLKLRKKLSDIEAILAS